MNVPATNNSRMVGVVVAMAGVIWFLMLGYRDLIDPDEGRYAEIAREMLVTGDWITPRLNGFKYFEKPPLQYWGSAVSMIIFGETSAAARIWSAGLGFIGALWTGFVGARLYGQRAGFYAFLFLISSALYFALGHVNTLDMGVSVFLSIAIGSLVLAQSERTSPSSVRNWMLLGWSALACATLSKGLIGLVLPGGAVFCYLVWQRDWALLRNLHLGKGVMLFLLITAPWFIAVSRANPEFAHFFFIYEHFERFTSNVHQRSKPGWFFFAVLLVGMLPWAATMSWSLIKPAFSWRAQPGRFEATRFLWVYLLFIFFFFSMSTSKLPPYILPMYFALALVAAEKAAQKSCFKIDGIISVLIAVGLGVLGVMVANLGESEGEVDLLLKCRPWIWVSALFFLAAGISNMICRNDKWLGPSVFALCALLALQMLSFGYQSFSTKRSAQFLARAVEPFSDKGVDIYSIYRYYHSLSYYLGKEVKVVGFTGELEFGIKREPGKWLTGMQFLELWPQTQQAVAVMPHEIFESWKKQEIPMRLIYQDAGHVAVVRQ